METPTSLTTPHNSVPPSPDRAAVITGTRGALETLGSLLAPAATIAIMAYGFKMMFRGVLER